MKVFLPAPGRTRNALRVEEERKIFLGAWEQAGHSIAANSFPAPGRRFPVLQGLAAHVFIQRLDRVVIGDESFPPASGSASAVFFHPPHHGGAMNLHPVTLPDQIRQVAGRNLGILFLLLESELEHFPLEFGGTLPAW